MKKTIIIPLAAGLFLVIIIGAGIKMMVVNNNQSPATNVTASHVADNTTTPAASDASATPSTTPVSSASYKDGSYSANGSYNSPDGQETIGVSVTVKSGNITDVSVTPGATRGDSAHYERNFASGISGIVSGKPLSSSFDVSQVNGSSLTGTGFTQALNAIRGQAKA